MDVNVLDISKETDHIFLSHSRSAGVEQDGDGVWCQVCCTKVMPKYFEGGNVRYEPLYEHLDGANDLPTNHVDVLTLKCDLCHKCIACWAHNRWRLVESLLQCTIEQQAIKCTLKKVVTAGERLILWILNQVIFKQYENEDSQLQYLNIPPEEIATLVWHKCHAIGFYTVRPKGHRVNNHGSSCFEMPVVDLIFVRKAYRGQGLGTMIVDDIVKKFGPQNIGFSKPITTPMYKVLEKYLRTNAKERDYFWEVGYDGYHNNVWLTLCCKAATLRKATDTLTVRDT